MRADRRTLGALVAAGLVDELFLTTSPLLAGRTGNGSRPALVEGIELLPATTVGCELLTLGAPARTSSRATGCRDRTAGSFVSVRLKRAYEPPAPADGYRVLIDRLWPRGVARANARLDEWAKELAPSTELRRWFGHDPARFAEFRAALRRGALRTGGQAAGAPRTSARDDADARLRRSRHRAQRRRRARGAPPGGDASHERRGEGSMSQRLDRTWRHGALEMGLRPDGGTALCRRGSGRARNVHLPGAKELR